MEIELEDAAIEDSASASRFEVHIGDDVAFLAYERRGSTIAYIHTEVPRSLEGHGIAGKLAKYALDLARANGLDVVPFCPYLAEYIKRHPEYKDLVAPRARWKEFLPLKRR